MKVCAISDMHGIYTFEIPKCDILFICGDIVPLKMQNNINQSLRWFRNWFLPWCRTLEADQIYMVGGNHDLFLEHSERKVKSLLQGTNITILYNEGAEYIDDAGKVWKIWGSPNCHMFGNWSFMYSDEFNKEQFEKMPKDLDFLITHDAPYGRNDVILQDVYWASKEHIGNIPLVKVINEKKPKYHFTGHLHSTDHNLVDYDGTKTACVSLLDEHYKLAYNPLVIEI